MEGKNPTEDIREEDAGRVSDVDAAREGAYAEKPFRDVALDGTLTLSSEERAALESVAMKVGARAAEEAMALKEKGADAQLTAVADVTLARLKEKGLEGDVEIMDRIRRRIEWWFQDLAQRKPQIEQAMGKQVTMREYHNTPMDPALRFMQQIPVFAKNGEKSGFVYYPNGRVGAVPEEWAEDEHKKRAGDNQADLLFVDEELTREGEEEFLRALGVLREDETQLDLPKRVQQVEEEQARARGAENPHVEVDPTAYSGMIPTGIEGVDFRIARFAKKGESSPHRLEGALVMREDWLDAYFKN